MRAHRSGLIARVSRLVCGVVVPAVLPAASAAAFPVANPQTPPPIKTLLITGENNHNWRFTSVLHAETLESTGRFDVDVTTTPQELLADANALKGYQLFVLDYNGTRWGEAGERNFLNAVRNGAGVVVIHASNNAFLGWADYEQMCGLMWINGRTGHGAFHQFDVELVARDHPILAGLPPTFTTSDELYHDLVNTRSAPFTLLARAMSTKESGGTGKHEPMAFTLDYGKGRVFHTPLGHVWTGEHAQKSSICDADFRILICRGAEWAATGAVTLAPEWKDVRQHNTITLEEKAMGWRLLFDGQQVSGLRGYGQPAMPAQGWIVEGGTLKHVKGAGGGDLITTDQFADFEFSLEWKVGPGGNSGIMYRVAETDQPSYVTGPEMQILDNGGHGDRVNPKTSAGALYGLIPCAHDVVRPAGEWNAFRIVCKRGKVEHWVNGVKVLEFELNGPGWADMLKGTKFEQWTRFGREPMGHIAIQDHGDDIWFRNIRVRALD